MKADRGWQDVRRRRPDLQNRPPTPASSGPRFLNLTGEYVDRGETNRAGPRLPARFGRHGHPDASRRDMKSGMLWFQRRDVPGRSGVLFRRGASSRSERQLLGFFRPSSDGRTIPALLPAGFLPTLRTTTDDYSRGGSARRHQPDLDLRLSVQSRLQPVRVRIVELRQLSWYYEHRAGGGIFGETPLRPTRNATLQASGPPTSREGTADWGIARSRSRSPPASNGATMATRSWRRSGFLYVQAGPTIPRSSSPTRRRGVGRRHQGFTGSRRRPRSNGKRTSVGVYGDAEAR